MFNKSDLIYWKYIKFHKHCYYYIVYFSGYISIYIYIIYEFSLFISYLFCLAGHLYACWILYTLLVMPFAKVLMLNQNSFPKVLSPFPKVLFWGPFPKALSKGFLWFLVKLWTLFQRFCGANVNPFPKVFGEAPASLFQRFLISKAAWIKTSRGPFPKPTALFQNMFFAFSKACQAFLVKTFFHSTTRL